MYVTDLPKLPPRPPNMHKGEAGRVLCVAGSVGMLGAAAICSRSALRSGAGLVRLAMPWRLAAIQAGRDPNTMTIALPETDDGTISATSPKKIIEAANGHDVVLMGPGLSTHPQTVQAVKTVLPELDCKLVLDADALNAIASDACECLGEVSRTHGLPILTPHPGEMIRLMGDEYDGHELKEDDAHREFVAVAFARRHQVVLTLKGGKTVVTDGTRVYINTTGNPGMAKAGMGDVLTGVVAALLGQGFSEFDATMLGVYLHGLAGDIVYAKMGEYGILATDVIEALPAAFQQHQQTT